MFRWKGGAGFLPALGGALLEIERGMLVLERKESQLRNPRLSQP